MLAWLLVAAALGFTTADAPSGGVARWPAMPIPWSLDPSAERFAVGEAPMVEAVQAAILAWQAVEGAEIGFRHEALPSSGVIRFEAPWPYDPQITALTFTRVDLDGRIVAFEVVLNGEHAWGSRGVDLQSVLVHELGHALGVGHSEVREAVMYATLDRGEIRRELHPDDEDAARYLYGPTEAGTDCASLAGTAAPVGLLVLLLPLARRRGPGGEP